MAAAIAACFIVAIVFRRADLQHVDQLIEGFSVWRVWESVTAWREAKEALETQNSVGDFHVGTEERIKLAQMYKLPIRGKKVQR